MPDASEHIKAACHNIEAINYLLDEPIFSDWVAVVLFYASLHIVDAILFVDSKTAKNHGETHNIRKDILKGTTRYRNIYKHYAPIDRASHIARYCENRDTGKTTMFFIYMPPEKMRDELIKHRFQQIINSAANFLPQKDSELLNQKFNSLSVFSESPSPSNQ